MNKKIKVIELLNLLAKNKTKEGTRIKYIETIYIVDFPNLCGIYPEGGTTRREDSLFSQLDICGLNYEVEILEDEEEIDIKDIDIIRDYRTSDDDLYNDNFDDFKSTINDLVKAVKQLDKKINKED